MGAYQGLLSGEFGEPAIDSPADSYIPYGMTTEMWSDVSDKGALDRAVHFVLTLGETTYADPNHDVMDEASQLFAVEKPDLVSHLERVATLDATNLYFES